MDSFTNKNCFNGAVGTSFLCIQTAEKNGFLLYATCALCPQENDGVVSKLLKKFPDVNIASKDFMKEIFDLNRKSIKADIFCPQDFSLEDYFSFAEKTEFGFHILPDKSFGAGPLYFSLIKNHSALILFKSPELIEFCFELIYNFIN